MYVSRSTPAAVAAASFTLSLAPGTTRDIAVLASKAKVACAPDNGGITLPKGVYATDDGPARAGG